MNILKSIINNSLFWKLYFWFSFMFFFLALFFLIIDYHIELIKINVFHWSLFISEILSIIGLYSFAFKKKIFSSKFWLFLFWYILITWNLTYIYQFLPDTQIFNYLKLLITLPMLTDQNYSLMILLTCFLISSPTYYAIYKLSQRRH